MMLAVVLSVCPLVGLSAQSPRSAAAETPPIISRGDTTLAVGRRYARGALHRWIFGSRYRELWAAEIRVPILDLSRYAGGLEPTREGGGMQTKSLRFRGRDGYNYNFRSIDKDPDVLPDILDGTFLDDIMQDQTRAQHPGGVFVAGPLLEAAGVLHTRFRLVMLPDVAQLGEFREEFGGMVGMIERRATVEDELPSFANATDIDDTEKVFPKVFESPDDRIDARALIRARLMDQLMGDWDRHRGNWDWALMRRGTPRMWVPIPKDRDHAFVHFDGLAPALARTRYPQVVVYGPKYGGLNGMAFNGRDIDRWFLGTVDGAVWDSIGLDLQRRITDAVIDSAAGELPEGWRALHGAELTNALRRRRDRFPDVAREYYRMLASEAELHLTAADEVVNAVREASGVLHVTVAARGARPHIERRYQPSETREVRVFLRGGSDSVMVRGDGPGGITLRLIGDSVAVVDSSRAGRVRRYASEWVPAPTALYHESSDTLPRRHAVDESKIEKPPIVDWGRSTGPVVWASEGPDVGLFIGGGIQRTNRSFRTVPYGSRWTLRGGWATGASTGRVMLSTDFRRRESRQRLLMEAWASGIEVIRWHGVGNQTSADSSREYYRVNRAEVGARASFVWPVARHLEVSAGPQVLYASTKSQPGRIIADSVPYGSGRFGMAGLTSLIEWDNRDHSLAPRQGLRIRLGAAWYPGIWDAQEAFGNAHVQASTYYTPPGVPFRPTLAVRGGAKRVWGKYPYAEAAFIGDDGTVRLGRQNRFAGDGAVWMGTELRMRFGRYNLVLPGDYGVFGLYDMGRVHATGETSGDWHRVFGGGIWFSVVEPKNVFSVAYTTSEGRRAIYARLGFAY